jgi:ABC-type multidrug transport system fused ATPase/permease subunit
MGSSRLGPVAAGAACADGTTYLLRDLWSVLTAAQRRWVVWAQFISLGMAFSTVTGIASIAPFFAVLGDPHQIDRVGIAQSLYHYYGSPAPGHFELELGITFMGVVVVANLINVAGSFAMITLAYRISTDLQSTLFGEYLSRPYAFHTRNHSTHLFNSVVNETTRVTNDVLQNVFQLITSTATAALIVLSVTLLNPALAAAMVVALAGGYLAIYLVVRNWLLRAGQTQSALLVEQSRTVNDALGAIKEVLVLRIQDYFRHSFERSSRKLGRAAANTLLVAQSPKYVMECAAVLGLVLIALSAANHHDGIGSRLGQLTFLGFAAYRLLPTLQQSFAALVRIRAERTRFAAIAPDLRLARSGARRAPVRPGAVCWDGRPNQEIHLRDVSFRYQPDQSAVVSGVTLRIPARTVVGFVGPNGSGKTTLVDLIAGLLAPAIGQIEIDGIALNESNRAHWQTRIAYVPQNVFLLDSTIARNIALGVADAAIDPSRLREVSRLAQLEDLLASLPEGLQHPIGERGVRLSGGQRQRIGIARALYTDASVLILDEATNALDGLTEQELMATLMQLRGRYTVILIAHRLGSVRACDVIFEFHQGRISARGSYAELLRDSVTFRRLVNLS